MGRRQTFKIYIDKKTREAENDMFGTFI